MDIATITVKTGETSLSQISTSRAHVSEDTFLKCK